jgi:hypothetical protein
LLKESLTIYWPWSAVLPYSSTSFDYYKIIKAVYLHHEIFHYSVLSSEVIISNQRLCLFLTGDQTSAPGSVLFSLRNNDDLAPFKLPLKDGNGDAAINRDSGYGPSFGLEDLVIANNAGSNTFSLAYIGDSYKTPPGYTFSQSNTRSLLAGSYYFSPTEVEVLYLN